MGTKSVLRTETIGCLITIIFSVIQLIASGTEIILSRSNYLASLPDSIVSEAKLIMFKPKMIASKLEINSLHDDQDCLSLVLDRYARKQDHYSHGEDRY